MTTKKLSVQFSVDVHSLRSALLTTEIETTKSKIELLNERLKMLIEKQRIATR